MSDGETIVRIKRHSTIQNNKILPLVENHSNKINNVKFSYLQDSNNNNISSGVQYFTELNLKNLGKSQLNLEMDKKCMELDIHPIKAHSFIKTHIECCKIKNLEKEEVKSYCFDDCGFRVNCTVNYSFEKNCKIIPDIKLELLNRYCISSRLQKELNSKMCSCPENDCFKVAARFSNNSWSCGEIDFNSVSHCVNDCNKIISCVGKLKSITKHNEVSIETLKNKFCACDETLKGNGINYTGCQTKTRNGYECKNWKLVKKKGNKTHIFDTLDHNYCRNPNNETTIWCYTTNPDVIFDYCNPLGSNSIYIQPGEKFDFFMEGFNLERRVLMRFFDGNNGKGKCGEGAFYEKVKGVHPGFPEYELNDGLLKLTWKKISIDNDYGSYLTCLCYAEFNTNLGISTEDFCSKPKHFTKLIANVFVEGPIINTTIVHQQTNKEFEIKFDGANLSLNDDIIIVEDREFISCETVSEFELFESSSVHRNNVAKSLSIQNAILFQLKFDQSKSKLGTRTVDTGVLPQIIIPRTGQYLVCWQGRNSKSKATALTLKISGIDTSQLFWVMSITTVNQSMFISGYGKNTHEKDSLKLMEINNVKHCSGNTVAKSEKNNSTQLSNNNYIIMFSDISLKFDKEKELSTLDVCLEDETTNNFFHIGYAEISTSLRHSFKSIFGEEKRIMKPHCKIILENDAIYNNWYIKNKNLKWGNVKFPLSICFWIEKNNRISAWVFSKQNISPSFLLAFNFKHQPTAVAVATYDSKKSKSSSAENDEVLLYVTNNSAVEYFNISNVNNEELISPPIKSYDVLQPVSIEVVAVLEEIYVLVVCKSQHEIQILDKDLNLIHKFNCKDDTSNSSCLSFPSDIACTKMYYSYDSYTINCYITDTKNNKIVWIQKTDFLQNFKRIGDYFAESSTNGVHTSLYDPVYITAVTRQSRNTTTTLIYVVELMDNRPKLLLQEENSTISFYNVIEQISSSAIIGLEIMSLNTDSDFSFCYLQILTIENNEGFVEIIPLDTTAKISEFTYLHPEWYKVGNQITLIPSIIGVNKLPTKYELLHTNYPNNFYLNKANGQLTGKIDNITDIEVWFQIEGIGAVNKIQVDVKFNVACDDGYYFNNKTCKACPIGTYNNFADVQANDSRWDECKKCDVNQITSDVASKVKESCLCDKGYELSSENNTIYTCKACSPGKWKDQLGITGCSGSCPMYSKSNVYGAKSSEERKCECYLGYYYDTSHNDQRCSKAEKGFYSYGGYNATKHKCPDNKTTIVSETPATSEKDCVCNAGYEPENLNDLKNTAAGNEIKCKACDLDKYKDSISDKPCKPCPMNSSTNKKASTNETDCNVCSPGYYYSSSRDPPCVPCFENAFCAGSAKGPVSCLPNSITNEPYNLNYQAKNCSCIKGYEPKNMTEDNTALIECKLVEQNFYKDTVGNTNAIACPGNSITHSAGSTSKTDCVCNAGFYWNDIDQCLKCPKGSFCIGGRDLMYNHIKAEKCSKPNSDTAEDGATSSQDCVCKAGYTNTENLNSCKPCEANTFKNQTSSSECLPCPNYSGTNNTKGATSKQMCGCVKGYYFDNENETCKECGSTEKYCPGGFVLINDTKKPQGPISCSPNTLITPGFNTASSLSDCKCARGYGYVSGNGKNKNCEPCKAGSYKSSISDMTCSGLCGLNSKNLPGAQLQSQCFCDKNYYFVPTMCLPCPEGAECNGGLLPEAKEKLVKNPSYEYINYKDHVKPFARRDYYLHKNREALATPYDWIFIKCPTEGACIERGECVETMANFLCSECKYGYTNGFNKNKICSVCPDSVQNVVLLSLWYLGQLFFNIIMTYFNVEAGFNRRSIHSIVIKIATNYFTCMSLLAAMDYSVISLPTWLATATFTFTKTFLYNKKTYFMSFDCLFRYPNMTHEETFFYTMVLYALLPVILPVLATILMFIILELLKWRRANATRKKLLLLRHLARDGLESLYNQLLREFEDERVFMIFRYIPIPGDSIGKRLKMFFEDMTPVYVTVLFFVHTSTTRRMLSLLDCQYYSFGNNELGKYFLRPAMSVECTYNITGNYMKFFLLGIFGTVTWGLGIPLVSYLVLYINRKNLNARDMRLKYGFLHNGFDTNRWYWETVVFIRKILVLIISSILFGKATSSNGARTWLGLTVAIIFLIIHLHYQPFDERNCFCLDKLENHSMYSWTFSLLTFGLLTGTTFNENVNLAVLSIACIANCAFLGEVIISLCFAYFDNVRAGKTFFTVPIIGVLFRTFAKWSERRRAREPIVIFDPDEDNIQLVAARRHRRFAIFRIRGKDVNILDRNYFVKVMAKLAGFAVLHLKLSQIPGDFLEFALRLGLCFQKIEEETQATKKSLIALAGEDFSQVLQLAKQEEKKKKVKKQLLQDESKITNNLEEYYENVEKLFELNPAETEQEKECISNPITENIEKELPVNNEETEKEKKIQEEKEKAIQIQEKKIARHQKMKQEIKELCAKEFSSQMNAQESRNVMRKIFDLTEEEQQETVMLLDKDSMNSGITLSDLYLSLLRMQLKDPVVIQKQFNAFKLKKKQLLANDEFQIEQRNRKLRIVRAALKSLKIDDTENMDLHKLGITAEDYVKNKKHLEEQYEVLNSLKEYLEFLKSYPMTAVGDNDEDEYDDEFEDFKNEQNNHLKCNQTQNEEKRQLEGLDKNGEASSSILEEQNSNNSFTIENKEEDSITLMANRTNTMKEFTRNNTNNNNIFKYREYNSNSTKNNINNNHKYAKVDDSNNLCDFAVVSSDYNKNNQIDDTTCNVDQNNEIDECKDKWNWEETFSNSDSSFSDDMPTDTTPLTSNFKQSKLSLRRGKIIKALGYNFGLYK